MFIGSGCLFDSSIQFGGGLMDSLIGEQVFEYDLYISDIFRVADIFRKWPVKNTKAFKIIK
jgi:hypothetical protein